MWEKIGGGKFGKFDEWCSIHNFSSPMYILKCDEVIENPPMDSPNFSKLFASSVMICYPPMYGSRYIAVMWAELFCQEGSICHNCSNRPNIVGFPL